MIARIKVLTLAEMRRKHKAWRLVGLALTLRAIFLSRDVTIIRGALALLMRPHLLVAPTFSNADNEAPVAGSNVRLNCETIVTIPEENGCTFFDAASCQEAAEALGLQIGGGGFNFAGDFPDKGCYFYPADGGGTFAGIAYFGTGGCNDEMEAPIPGETRRRLDCKTTLSPEGDGCTFHSPETCRVAAQAQGLEIGGAGLEFAASYTVAGCYYYPWCTGTLDERKVGGRAYFGVGGSNADNEASLPGPSIRLNCETIVTVPQEDGCSFYDAASCQEAAETLGLQIGGGGFSFAGSLYTNNGCYYYPPDGGSEFAGMAYFGTGGCNEDMEASISGETRRLDCETTLSEEGDGCTFYSAETCRVAAQEQGLELGGAGFDFEGVFADVGCYFYPTCTSTPNADEFAGRAYFGVGGSDTDKAASLSGATSRLNCKTKVSFPQENDCTFYDAASCRVAAETLGLQIGGGNFDFEGSYPNKGCYYYPPGSDSGFDGMAFFGTGGCNAQMETQLASPTIRLNCVTSAEAPSSSAATPSSVRLLGPTLLAVTAATIV